MTAQMDAIKKLIEYPTGAVEAYGDILPVAVTAKTEVAPTH